jgi:hypothetical protein
MAYASPAPSSSNRLIGRGSALLAAINPSTLVRGNFVHVGNTPDFTLQTETREVENKSFMHSDSRVLDIITIETKARFRMGTQEFSLANVRYALMAAAATYTQAATPVVAEPLGDVELGAFYPLDKRYPSTLTLSDGGSLTEGEDWILWDAAESLVYIPPTSGATVGEPLTASYTPSAVTDAPILYGAQQTSWFVSCRFYGDPAYGAKWNLAGWKGRIKPQDALALIGGEDIGKLSLEITMLDDSLGLYGGSQASPLYSMWPTVAADEATS